jgi:hypothetical protein
MKTLKDFVCWAVIVCGCLCWATAIVTKVARAVVIACAS